MRAVRFLSLALLMVVGFAGAASAEYNNRPDVYQVNIAVVPAMLPPGSLPAGFPLLGPDLYRGTLTITATSTGYSAAFQGLRTTDGVTLNQFDKLNINATFNKNWAGFNLGTIVVGSSGEADCVIGIDGANLINANINGIGTVDGLLQRLIAKVDAGGVVGNWKVLKAPGNLR